MPSAIFNDRYAAAVEVIAKARRQAGLTQVQLAERLDRPQSYVSKIERRERRMDIVELYDWALAVSSTPEALIATVLERLKDQTSGAP